MKFAEDVRQEAREKGIEGFDVSMIPPKPAYTSPPIDWAKLGIESAKTGGGVGVGMLPFGIGAVASPFYRAFVDKTSPYPLPGGPWSGVPIDLAASILPGWGLGFTGSLKLAAKAGAGAGVAQGLLGREAQKTAEKVGEVFAPGLTKDIVTGAIASLPAMGGAMYGQSIASKLGTLATGKLPPLAMKTGIAEQAAIPRAVAEGREAEALLEKVSPKAFGKKAPVSPMVSEEGVMKETLKGLQRPLGEKVGAAQDMASDAIAQGDFSKAKQTVLLSLMRAMIGEDKTKPKIGFSESGGKIKFDPSRSTNELAANVVVDAFEKARTSKSFHDIQQALQNLGTKTLSAFDSETRAATRKLPIYTSFKQAFRSGIDEALAEQAPEAGKILSKANKAYGPAAEISELITDSFDRSGNFSPKAFKGYWKMMEPKKKIDALGPELTQQINTVLNFPESETLKRLKDLFQSAIFAGSQFYTRYIPASPWAAGRSGIKEFKKLPKETRFYAPSPEPGFIRTAASYGPLFMQRLAEERERQKAR